jgi:hypothetical protein
MNCINRASSIFAQAGIHYRRHARQGLTTAAISAAQQVPFALPSAKLTKFAAFF